MPRTPARLRASPAHHVLVIDDAPEIIEILTEALGDEGVRVTGLPHPPPVEEVARLAPNAIVLDLIFGNSIAGYSFLEAVRQHPATAPIPVVICSAATGTAAEVTARFLGPGVHLVPKPFDLDELVAVLMKAPPSPPTPLRAAAGEGRRGAGGTC